MHHWTYCLFCSYSVNLMNRLKRTYKKERKKKKKEKPLPAFQGSNFQVLFFSWHDDSWDIIVFQLPSTAAVL